MIRMVNKSYYNAHTEPIFKKLNLLKFLDIHLMHLGQFMFSFKNAILPGKFEMYHNQQPNPSLQYKAGKFLSSTIMNNKYPTILCILSRS